MSDCVSVLTIDDDPLVRESLAAFLEDMDYRVLEASNGEEGMACFRQERPQVVLTDLNMPVKDGLGVLADLQQESPETPVIVISGAGDIQYAVQALKLGAWDYVMKPIMDMHTLGHAIERSLEKVQLRTDNAAYKLAMERLNAQLCHSLDLITVDQEAGYRVQRGLLPPLKQERDGWYFDLFFLPALYLSGDFVDYQIVNDRFTYFYIADVSGHGVSSAFGTVLLKNFMSDRCAAYLQGSEKTLLTPSALLAKTGDLFRNMRLGKYLTMCYGIYDKHTQVLTYSIGGHYPNPVVRDTAGVRYLHGSGFPIGVLPNAQYTDESLQLQPPFDIFCFSDGILEIFPDKTLQEKEAILLEACSDPAASVSQWVEKWALEEYPERPDDITFLHIKSTV